MTASGKSEQRSSTGARTQDRAQSQSPPWQRVTDDGVDEQSVESTTTIGSVFAGGRPVADGHVAGEHDEGGNMTADDGTDGKRSAPSALRRPGRGPRRASLQVKRFDPWSVLKLSLVFGVTLFFIWLVAVGVLYLVLDGMGVWDQLNGMYASVVEGTKSDDGGQTEPLISATRVFGIAAVIGAINIVLMSALATVGAFIYNVCADLAGGLEVTLSERE